MPPLYTGVTLCKCAESKNTILSVIGFILSTSFVSIVLAAVYESSKVPLVLYGASSKKPPTQSLLTFG